MKSLIYIVAMIAAMLIALCNKKLMGNGYDLVDAVILMLVVENYFSRRD